MSELLMKYNSLDALGKQELLDFLDFLVQKRGVKPRVLTKMELMKLAAKDPIYLQDIRDVENDFRAIDHETI